MTLRQKNRYEGKKRETHRSIPQMSSSAARPLQESKPVARESSVTTLLEADEPTQTPEPKNPRDKPKSEPGGRSDNKKKKFKLYRWSGAKTLTLVQEASELLDGAGFGCHYHRWISGARPESEDWGLTRRARPGFGLTIWRGFMCAVKREKDWRGAGASREGKSERGRKRAADSGGRLQLGVVYRVGRPAVVLWPFGRLAYRRPVLNNMGYCYSAALLNSWSVD